MLSLIELGLGIVFASTCWLSAISIAILLDCNTKITLLFEFAKQNQIKVHLFLLLPKFIAYIKYLFLAISSAFSSLVIFMYFINDFSVV